MQRPRLVRTDGAARTQWMAPIGAYLRPGPRPDWNASHRIGEVVVRELHMPLQRQDAPPRTGAGELTTWAECVRRTRQPCLLLGIDGALVAVSATARDLLGPAARPGRPENAWWREHIPHAPALPGGRSLLSRAAASGTAAHSVVQLVLDDVAVSVQVLIAPLETAGPTVEALLVFVRPVPLVAPG